MQANEIYLINISNYSSSQSGYTIDFGESTATIFDTLPPRALNDTLSCTQTSVKIIFNEPVACSSLTFSGSDFAIADNSGNKIFPQSITYVGCDSLHPYITEAEIFLNVPLSNSAVYYLLAANGSDQNTIADLCGNFVSAEDTLATFVMVNNLSVDLGVMFTHALRLNCHCFIRLQLQLPATTGITTVCLQILLFIISLTIQDNTFFTPIQAACVLLLIHWSFTLFLRCRFR